MTVDHRGGWTNWAGNVSYGARRVLRPTSIEELRRVVAATDKIRALGSGHSFSAIADTTYDLVRLDSLPMEMSIDADRATVTVAAGARVTDFVGPLDATGFALANLASLPHVTIAGSCATATHGSGDAQRCLSASVASLMLVTHEGELVEVSRTSHPDSFAGMVVALGGLGIVTHVTLDTVPSYSMVQWLYTDVPPAAIAANLDGTFGAAYSVSVFTSFVNDTWVWLKSRSEDDVSYGHGRRADRQLNPCPGMPPNHCTPQLGAVGPWYQRLPHYRPDLTPGAGDELQSEYFVPRAVAGAAFEALTAIADRIAPVLHIAEIRSVRGDDLWLSPASGEDMITFHFTWVNELDAVIPTIAVVEDQLMPLGARPHWAKLTTAGWPDIRACYPRIDAFANLVAEFDPRGKFSNAFLEALLRSG